MKKSVLNLQKRYKVFLTLFIFLFALSLVSGASVIINQGDNSLELKYPVQDSMLQGSPYEFNFHVFNKSTGMPITTGISCYFHLYNSTGDHVAELEDDTVDHMFDFDFTITANNFSTPGIYPYIISCNNSHQGGFVSTAIEVTPTGYILTTAKGVIYILLTLMLFILLIVLLWFNIIIPYKNKENVKGEVIRIVRTKYLKIALIPITHAVFNWFLNLLLSISTNLTTELNIYSGMIGFVFEFSMFLVYPLWVFCFVWFFFNIIRDFKWTEKIKKFGRVVK